MRYALLVLATLCVMTPFTAARADDDGLKLPPEGHTLLNLSASERMTLPQDLLMASLRIESKSADPKKVQNEINTAMDKALAMAKKVANVKVSTGGYQVYERYVDKTTKVWQGQQTIQLESKDSAALLDIAGKIQESGFVMSGLNYTLSPEKAEEVQDDLMVKALAKLQAKADKIAKALGKSGYALTDINIDGSGPVMPMYKSARMEMAMSADAGMAAPVAEAGETDVSLSVSARVLLKP